MQRGHFIVFRKLDVAAQPADFQLIVFQFVLVPDAAVIEIVLGPSVVVRVPAGADDQTLRQVLAALATRAAGTEGASC